MAKRRPLRPSERLVPGKAAFMERKAAAKKKSQIPVFKPDKDKKDWKIASPRKTPIEAAPAARADAKSKASPKEELHRGLAKGLSETAAGLSGRGTAGRVLKAALGGAAGGFKIAASLRRYKDRKRAKQRAKRGTTTTVSQAAVAKKADYHKKDKTPTEKV